jgi:hypothetical protein
MVQRNGKDNLRSFSVVSVRDNKGNVDQRGLNVSKDMRLVKRNPLSAAKSAANLICRYKKIAGVCVMFITVKETTQGSKNKEFTYKARRQKLDTPVKVGDVEYHYETVVKSIRGPVNVNAHTGKKMINTKNKTRKAPRRN